MVHIMSGYIPTTAGSGLQVMNYQRTGASATGVVGTWSATLAYTMPSANITAADHFHENTWSADSTYFQPTHLSITMTDGSTVPSTPYNARNTAWYGPNGYFYGHWAMKMPDSVFQYYDLVPTGLTASGTTRNVGWLATDTYYTGYEFNGRAGMSLAVRGNGIRNSIWGDSVTYYANAGFADITRYARNSSIAPDNGWGVNFYETWSGDSAAVERFSVGAWSRANDPSVVGARLTGESYRIWDPANQTLPDDYESYATVLTFTVSGKVERKNN